MDVPDTYKLRLSKLKRREQLTIWVAAGLGGLVVLLGVDVVQDAPEWLVALILTSIIIGGLALAFARVQFEWAATQITRVIEHNNVEPDTVIPKCTEMWEWPSNAEKFWVTTLLSIGIAGALMLIAVWWVVLSHLLC